MKRISLFLITSCIFTQFTFSQQLPPMESLQNPYRAAPEKVNDLVHTKLEARLDYQKSQLNGKVWLTLKPHFYPVDSVQLDAKGMAIHKIQFAGVKGNTPVTFTYDSLKLNIRLPKKFTADEKYTIYIEYTAMPENFPAEVSGHFKGIKGLHFINPDGKDKDTPTQVWTQGETDFNSVWLPTIDQPNQKSTQEMILTVPDKYVSLSNGQLVKQEKNSDGTRTDTWRMDMPHAPYLFFIGVGDYAIVKDSYKDKEVSYYVEKPYRDVARKIFGDTPAMMEFFSKKLGVEYPWAKYAQITARDYVGAMENTTATLHSADAQQNARQLTDGNPWEVFVAHELVHQWFGDLVTCESWSHATVNESFTTYSEVMWLEHKYGKDEAEAYCNLLMRQYLNSVGDTSKALVRYHYANELEMLDLVSLQKGAVILSMLRNFVGEDAFNESLKTYLTRNTFGTGNARELQQAFEDVTGKDLNWFFDQWFYRSGHPELDITYDYDAKAKKAIVYVKQTQAAPPFKLPIAIDVYDGPKATRSCKWIAHRSDTFEFAVNKKPELINVDADKMSLVSKDDHKTLKNFIHQYRYAKTYVDRREAVTFASSNLENPEAASFLRTALKDSNWRLRYNSLLALRSLDLKNDPLVDVVALVKNDPKKLVSSAAISLLAGQAGDKHKDLFISCLKDSSYTVAGEAFSALIDMDEELALKWLPELRKDARGPLEIAVKKAEILSKTDAHFNELYDEMANADIHRQYNNLPNFLIYLKRVNDVQNFKKGIDVVLKITNELQQYNSTYNETTLKALTKLRDAQVAKKLQGISTREMEAQIRVLDEALRKVKR